MLFVLVENCSSKLHFPFLFLVFTSILKSGDSVQHADALLLLLSAFMALLFIFMYFSNYWFFNISLVNLTLNLEFVFYCPYNVYFLDAVSVFIHNLSYCIVYSSGNLSYIDAVFWYSLFFTLNWYIWKERYLAWWALLTVRTHWIFQCYILFLGCKNMHLIGMYTWGFCKSHVLKCKRYVLNIDWFLFYCLFSVISSNSSKYAATTSVSYRYVLLKEDDIQCLHSEISKCLEI